MALITVKIDDKILKDFDIVASINHRNRSVHLRELMLAEIKKESRKNPELFKGG